MMNAVERALHNIDPVIAGILSNAIDGKDVSVDEAYELLECSREEELKAIIMVADMLRKKKVGDHVSYVVNRNINFTNVCKKRCGF